jgi:ubiquinone/menaquinone biosynthesis C-methylase UbiE
MHLPGERLHWAEVAAKTPDYVFYSPAEYEMIVDALGGVHLAGQKVLDIGCGGGVWTANFARLGAYVHPCDLAESIVSIAADRAAPRPTYPFVSDMHNLAVEDAAFDAIFGSMVLHHAADHALLGRELARVLKPGGCAVFHENSARNPVLMLARRFLVGRWGIPKNSSPGEHPLRPEEISAFAQAFSAYRVIYGRMFLLQLAVKYLFRREHGFFFALARDLDDWLYRSLPNLRALTYYQIVVFRK